MCSFAQGVYRLFWGEKPFFAQGMRFCRPKIFWFAVFWLARLCFVTGFYGFPWWYRSRTCLKMAVSSVCGVSAAYRLAALAGTPRAIAACMAVSRAAVCAGTAVSCAALALLGWGGVAALLLAFGRGVLPLCRSIAAKILISLAMARSFAFRRLASFACWSDVDIRQPAPVRGSAIGALVVRGCAVRRCGVSAWPAASGRAYRGRCRARTSWPLG